MNKQRVSLYIERVRTILNELENEMRCDSINTLEGIDYQDILCYYESEKNNHEEHF